MIFSLRCACLTSMLALLLSGCALLPDLATLLREAEDVLPLAPIGGIPIQVVADVEFDHRETIEGAELVSSTGAWTHTQEGRLLSTLGWQPHRDQIDEAHGGGRIHCYYDWGQEDPSVPHWTVQWSSELSFDDPGRGSAMPLIEIATYGDEALVLYAPPREFTYWHPGSPDDCQNPDPVEAHQATGDLPFFLDDIDVERPPDAETSTHTAIQDGLVLLRIPLDTLRDGTSETNTVNVGGSDQGYYGTTEWSLTVTLTLTSSPDGL